METQHAPWDVVVVGGGAAGLSAALMLGRALRRTLVLDAGTPRNAPSPEAHSFFTRDGTPPGELVRIGREQLRPYDTVLLRDLAATDARADGDGFVVTTADGREERTRALVLATGIVDELPPIDGLRALWGTGVLHCPFCHGWEVRGGPLAALGNDASHAELAALLTGWSRDVTLLTDGPCALDDATRADLAARGVALDERPVLRLAADGDGVAVEMGDGARLTRAAVYLRPPFRQRSDLGARLGCALEEDGLLRVDPLARTTVPRVYAAGDCTLRMQQIAGAAWTGLLAAAAAHRDLGPPAPAP